ncbi:MAG: DNA-3-methyladenine glycosylase 2 family protein [Gemmatimonas sp.]|nr:DNA-3-methyladenine glycosylase 2 family protein [Gemmatimonas sp.]
MRPDGVDGPRLEPARDRLLRDARRAPPLGLVPVPAHRAGARPYRESIVTSDLHTASIPAEAVDYLRRVDPILAGLVSIHGALEYPIDSDLWRSLVSSIVGQQLSIKAAATIRERVAALDGGFPTPETIETLSDESLRGCGLSRAKVGFLRDLARRWLAGEIDPPHLERLPDEEVIEHLVRVRGVGRWTAEMVLIFSLGRPDVLAVDDLGLRSAAQRLYGLAERPEREEFDALGAPWRPYRSYASLYLWQSLKT